MIVHEAKTLLQRAEAARQVKNYLEAEHLYRQLAGHLGYSLGPAHFEVAIVLHELALLLEEQDRQEEALEVRKEAMMILQKCSRTTAGITHESISFE